MSKQTFDIRDGAGFLLASVTFNQYGVNLARREALAIAELLCDGDGWSVADRDEQPVEGNE